MPDKTDITLILKKQWFDMIESGQKTIEYRDATDYWLKRIVNRTIKIIHFRHGYASDARRMIFRCNAVHQKQAVIELHLGERIV